MDIKYIIKIILNFIMVVYSENIVFSFSDEICILYFVEPYLR